MKIRFRKSYLSEKKFIAQFPYANLKNKIKSYSLKEFESKDTFRNINFHENIICDKIFEGNSQIIKKRIFSLVNYKNDTFSHFYDFTLIFERDATLLIYEEIIEKFNKSNIFFIIKYCFSKK